VFLQGLLLIPPDQLPDYFHPVRGILSAYNDWLDQRRLSPLEGALTYVRSRPEIDAVIVGVCATEELREILEAWSRLTSRSVDMSAFRCDEEKFVNPAIWRVSK
jgi:aryl-alcohol dehydrogenase-like predicted oxidoreductase